MTLARYEDMTLWYAIALSGAARELSEAAGLL